VKRKQVINTGELKALREELRSEGKTVAFTNGCFDLMHVGHVRCLQDAAGMADVLVVGLNSDDSVGKNKGPEFPVHNQDERAEMLLALEGVDCVVVFGEPTVDGILEELYPDIYAKGPDYPLDKLPERDTVIRLNIDFRNAGDPKGHASRDTIETILARFAPGGK